MIRSVVALFVFAIFLCAYIVLRPNTSNRPSMVETTDVTRAHNDSILGPIPDVIASLDSSVTQAPLL